MKFIPLGLQCSVPEALRKANVREYSYPFDWLWSPSITTYTILKLLLTEGINSTIEYMTTGWSYYTYLNNEHYITSDKNTESQMNKITGLGITHFTINDDFKEKLQRRLERLLDDIKSNNELIFIYADAANLELNYHINDICYGLPATNDLLKIYELLQQYSNNFSILYFCWNENNIQNTVIKHIPFDYQPHWFDVCNIIKKYIEKTYTNNNILENNETIENNEIIFD